MDAFKELDYRLINKVTDLNSTINNFNSYLKVYLRSHKTMNEELRLTINEESLVKSYYEALSKDQQKIKDEIFLISKRPKKDMRGLEDYFKTLKIIEEFLKKKGLKAELFKKKSIPTHDELGYFYKLVVFLHNKYKKLYNKLLQFLSKEEIIKSKPKRPRLYLKMKAMYLGHYEKNEPKGIYLCLLNLEELRNKDPNQFWINWDLLLAHESIHYLQDEVNNEIVKSFKKASSREEELDNNIRKVRSLSEHLADKNSFYEVIKEVYEEIIKILSIKRENLDEETIIKKISLRIKKVSEKCLLFSKRMKELSAEEKREVNKNVEELPHFYDKKEKWRYEEIFTRLLSTIIKSIKLEIKETVIEGGADFLSQYFGKKALGYDIDYEKAITYKTFRLRAKKSFELKKNFIILDHLHKLNPEYGINNFEF